MEEVIQVLMFIVIVASVIIGKSKEVKSTPPKQHAPRPKSRIHTEKELDEFDTKPFADELNADAYDADLLDFDELDYDKSDAEEYDREENDSEAFNHQRPGVEKSHFDEYASAKYAFNDDYSTKPSESYLQEQEANAHTESTQTNTLPQTPRRPHIHIRNLKEARQAFIYSEIFNRKYK